MNLQVFAPNGDVTIGATTFTSTPVDLVNIACLTEGISCWNEMWLKAKSGGLQIKENGVTLPDTSTGGDPYSSLAYMGRLISKQESGTVYSDYPKLEADWAAKS